MVRFSGLILSILSLLLFVSPAQAGRLLFWRFESSRNQLVFRTDDRVQPRAQLIFNPTRVVIDLPGVTFGRPKVNQAVGSIIRNVRVGQFDAQTTRIVIELAPGYTVDPQQVKVRGLSPTQWIVDLPTPQRIEENPGTPPSPAQPESIKPPAALMALSSSDTTDFQVTRNGLFVRLNRNGDFRKVSLKRSRDRQTITVELPGASLPASLKAQTFPVNSYGVSTIEFEQPTTASARILLQVTGDSPNWQALYSRLGGLVLLPQGGMNVAEVSYTPPSTPLTPSNLPPSAPSSQNATIQSLDLVNNNSQLLIRADRSVRAQGRWNNATGTYDLRIANAQLSDAFRGPQLGRNSPIYQLRIRQEDANTVTVIIRPAFGTRLGTLRQLTSQLLALDIQSTSNPGASDSSAISVSPPLSTTLPPLADDPAPSLPNVSRGRVLVVIDPGHGGKDPGAIGIGGVQEKDVILPISQQVTRLLEQQGVQVMMTRSGDYFVSLQGRTDLANRARADLFVSIHANSMGMGRPDINGLEVYYFGDRRLADTIHKNIRRSVSIGDRGVRRARFYVLRNSRMPSTLVEVGFLTGYEDSPKLTDPAFRSQMAVAIARGILEFIQQNNIR
jgi:N-acetylmuramoyl-L-alanine amidase